MYYGEIKNCDIANGEGVRVSLFVSGCTNRCKGCFQPQTWDFDYGEPFTAQTAEKLLEMLAPDYIDDSPKNVEVAQSLGIHTLCPRNNEDWTPMLCL